MDGKSFDVGIIGGDGKMGSFLKKAFEKEHTVYVSDKESKLSNVDLVKKCNVIIVSVPIRETVSVIEEISPHLTEDHLLLDVCSLKEKPCRAMAKTKAHVVGMHPMFAPSCGSMENQTVVLCPLKETPRLSCMKGFFESAHARVVVTTPENHDKMMGIIQCLTHFISIVYVLTMKNLDVEIKELVDYASPVYLIELLMSGRILAQDKSLYTDIQMQNPKSPEVLKAFSEATLFLETLVKEGNVDGFEKTFEELSNYLGPLKKTASEVSSELVKVVNNKKETILKSAK
ncbi:prephenate dehydrogenase [Candidatus Aerophobetes bacterium]|uniref:Prephenate dehydrogenase n=1 Tax=Aerophobetes bacterium TaxID=2030807 RepID=A0A2A4YKY1_UNCAE|nr:MAG: prephenate dehydrogenase [Candidatus Aerophobetes bacterium]